MSHRPARSATGGHTLLPAFSGRGPRINLLDIPAVPTKTFLRWTFGRDTVIWRIWPAVLLHTCFAAAVVTVSLTTNLSLDFPPVLLTVLGVVIGFVISYRAMSGYDRYWMGRTTWSDVVRNSRTLSRLIWFHVPLRITVETKNLANGTDAEEVAKLVMAEKRLALNLIEAFSVALKHHLRGEGGIYYEDLYPLVKSLYPRAHRHHHHNEPQEPHHEPSHPISGTPEASRTTSPTNSMSPGENEFLSSQSSPIQGVTNEPVSILGLSSGVHSDQDPYIPPINGYGTFNPSIRSCSSRSSSLDHSDVRRPLRPSKRRTERGVIDSVSGDLVPFSGAWTALGRAVLWPQRVVRGWRAAKGRIELPEDGAERGYDDDSSICSDPEQFVTSVQGGVQRRAARGDAADRGRKRRPRVAGAGGNVPLAVVRSLSSWLSVLEGRGTVPGSSLGSMIGCLGTWEESLSVLEKILTTPLPFVYAVHIRTVWIYLFFLPFQLISQFGWYTIPGVGMAAFIYLGFVAAGEEIEQPFGYDENDLDLDLFCQEIVHADLDRLRRTACPNAFLGVQQAPRGEGAIHNRPASAFAHIVVG